jgi:hypothetical protein
MPRNRLTSITCTTFVFMAALTVARPMQAQAAPSPYPNMAPLEQYLMDRDAEIALARSAAPEIIAKDAEVLVLGRKGYETAVNGKNGFVCVVHRSWTSEAGDAEFWNPKRRGPMCLNAKAARAYLPNTILRTNLVLAGKSETQMFDALKTAYEQKELPALEPGAMCYMLSRQGYLNDRGGHWHPHVMFFLPPSEAASWGANLSGSPIFEDDNAPDRMTVFMVPVPKWSDGTSDTDDGQ